MPIAIEEILISPGTSILTAVEKIDTSSRQIVLVVDDNRRLVGTVTDGDVRRGLLRGIRLEEPVVRVMNQSPRHISPGLGREAILRIMRESQIHQLPVVDQSGRVVGVEILDFLLQPDSAENWVVLMAGGLGMRLRPITESLPKPMVPVGGRPLLENILEKFISSGFNRFFFSVNYKAELVQAHFGDGSRFGANIDYLHEKERRGTAGALSLLPERPACPIIVMNGDLLTSVNFRQLLDFHRDHRATATVCVREYAIQVPYGVMDIDGHSLTGITEKPTQKFFVNAGIYVVEPDALDLIPNNRMFDMPELLQALLNQNRSVTAFPIREYWMDVGRLDDLERAQAEYSSVFGS